MKLIGIGDNVVDRYINKRIMFPGGNAVNFAVYAHQCGEESAYLGLIADEPEGWLIYDSLKEIGVDVSHSQPVKGLTTERCDVTLVDGDRTFVGCEYGEGEWKPLRLGEEHFGYLSGFDVIHCGCYADMADEILKLDAIQSVKTYDFSSEEEYRTDEYLNKVCPHVDIALFSQEEMTDDQALELQKKVHDLGTELVIVTNGSKGQKRWDGNRLYNGKVKMVEAVDTMGAGDSFFTAFVVQLMREGYRRGIIPSEEGIQRAFEFAADFSAGTCMKDGAFGFGTEY